MKNPSREVKGGDERFTPLDYETVNVITNHVSKTYCDNGRSMTRAERSAWAEGVIAGWQRYERKPGVPGVPIGPKLPCNALEPIGERNAPSGGE